MRRLLATPIASPSSARYASSTPVPLPSATPSPTASAAPTASLSGALRVDLGLLAALPATVDGSAPEAIDPDELVAAAADPGLLPIASALAIAYVASPSKEDWATAYVVALRPGALDETAERSWRDTFDAGVCVSEGGPGGHAEAALGGRTVYITTCGGLIVHHLRLAAPDRLVAVISAGSGRYGERIASTLRP